MSGVQASPHEAHCMIKLFPWSRFVWSGPSEGEGNRARVRRNSNRIIVQCKQRTFGKKIKTRSSVWLRGSNQGDKAGTYLATRSNGLFATEEMENFMIESGMGLPECGNSPWAAMLTETPSGHSRGFSFAKRGKVYRYVDDEELQERSDGVSQMEPSAVQATRNVALSKKQLSKRERRDYCEEEDESLWEI